MKVILLWFFVLSGVCLKAQNYLWAKNYITLPLYNSSPITAIATDGNGNLYMIGDYNGNIDVNGDTSLSQYYYNSHSLWMPNHFIAKIEPNGQTDWINNVQNDSLAYTTAIAADTNANVYYSIQETVNSVIMRQTNGVNQRILSIRASNFLYDDAVIQKIALNDSFLYIAGTFQDSVYIGNVAFASGCNTGGGSFVAKYNLITSTYVWVKQISTSPSVFDVSGLIADNSGNVFISGLFGQSVIYGGCSNVGQFDGFTLVCSQPKGFVAKINASGSYQWANQVGASGEDVLSFGLSMDNYGNIYNASMNYGSDSALLEKISSTGVRIWNKLFLSVLRGIVGSGDAMFLLTDAGVSCLDTAGNARWFAINAANNSGQVFNSLITSAKDGKVYTVGRFSGSLNIGGSLLINPSYNPNGVVRWDQYVALLYNKQDSATGTATIRGRVYFDNNSNCIYDAGDSAARNWGIIASPGNYLATTDSSGYYNLSVPPGSYMVSEILPEEDAGQLTQTCPVGIQYTTGNLSAGGVDTAINFANQFTMCSYTYIFPEYTSILNCGTPFTIPILFCNYTTYDIGSDIVQLGVSDSIMAVSTTPAFDYYDTVMHKFIFNNIQIPADSCIQINISGERLCNQGNTTPIPLTINVQVPTPCINSMNYDSISLRIQWGVGVINISDDANIKVYPNPFQDQVFVSLDRTGGNGQLTIRDIMGKEIMTVPINGTGRTSLDLGFLASGVYVLFYQSDQGNISKRIVKD